MAQKFKLKLNNLKLTFASCRAAAKRLLLLSLLLVALPAPAQKVPQGLGAGYDFANNGKVSGKSFKQMYIKSTPEIRNLFITADSKRAAQLNKEFLDRITAKQTFKAGNLQISANKLIRTNAKLQQMLQQKKADLQQEFDFYQIEGEDSLGNVHFTGYFTPVLQARYKADAKFKHPLYAMPGLKSIPARQAIDQGNALQGKNLELAYTSSLLENYFLQVQGSGVLEFADGSRKLIGYAGQNNKPYRSIGKMLVSSGAISAEKISLRSIREWFAAHPDKMQPMLNKNPSYVFFKWRKKKITGAAGIPLTAMHSVAVDKKCIPYGACLIAEVPVLDANGSLAGHRLQLLFAHDTGGAIRGPGHLDLFHGNGSAAGDKAGDLHHYGRVWLLLAK
jgi:membrane-bound lytic murein transglycosylase A